MKTAMLLLCSSALVLGYDGTCSTESCAAPEDDVQLMQTHAKLHKHKRSKTDVLASFEKKAGPVAMQTLMRALMNLPKLKSKEAMLAAVHTQPQLQRLAKRYPDDLKALGIFEDVESIHELKAAMFKVHHSSMAKQKGGTSLMKFKKDSEEPAAYLVWLESWGCDASIAFTDFPKADMGQASAPLFSPDCQGWPWVDNYAVSPAEEGAYFVFGNWSDVTYETEYHAAFVGQEGVYVLGSLGSDVYSTAFGSDALHFIQVQGDWPNQTYHLMSAMTEAPEGGATEALAMTDCLYPWGLKSVPGSNTLLWHCSKDWNLDNDTNKIMQWSGDGAPTVLVETDDWFGHVVVTGSKLFYSMYGERGDGTWGNQLYSCSLADCQPEDKGPVPNDAWHFVVSEFGELITTSYVSWSKSTSEGTDYWTEYDVHSDALDTLGADSPTLFTISGDQRLQLLDFRQGPNDLTEDHPDLPDGGSGSDDGSGSGDGSVAVLSISTGSGSGSGSHSHGSGSGSGSGSLGPPPSGSGSGSGSLGPAASGSGSGSGSQGPPPAGSGSGSGSLGPSGSGSGSGSQGPPPSGSGSGSGSLGPAASGSGSGSGSLGPAASGSGSGSGSQGPPPSGSGSGSGSLGPAASGSGSGSGSQGPPPSGSGSGSGSLGPAGSGSGSGSQGPPPSGSGSGSGSQGPPPSGSGSGFGSH